MNFSGNCLEADIFLDELIGPLTLLARGVRLRPKSANELNQIGHVRVIDGPIDVNAHLVGSVNELKEPSI
jgi:hypothetical protein